MPTPKSNALQYRVTFLTRYYPALLLRRCVLLISVQISRSVCMKICMLDLASTIRPCRSLHTQVRQHHQRTHSHNRSSRPTVQLSRTLEWTVQRFCFSIFGYPFRCRPNDDRAALQDQLMKIVKIRKLLGCESGWSILVSFAMCVRLV